MAHGDLNYDVNVGSSFVVSLTWYFPDDPTDAKSEFNTRQDLTDWTGEITCSSLPDFPLELTLGGVNGTIDGEIQYTSAWTAGTHDYKLTMTAPDATIDTILTGKICVKYVPSF